MRVDGGCFEGVKVRSKALVITCNLPQQPVNITPETETYHQRVHPDKLEALGR